MKVFRKRTRGAENDGSQMSLIEHLVELRSRLTKCAAAVVIVTVLPDSVALVMAAARTPDQEIPGLGDHFMFGLVFAFRAVGGDKH